MRIFTLVLSLGAFCQVQAAIPATHAPESHHYADYDRDFKLQLPEKWQVQRQFMGLDIFAAAPQENDQLGYRANISVISADIDEPVTLDQYVNKNMENLKNSLTDFNLIESGKLYFDGTEARKLVYTHKMNDLVIKVSQYFALNDKRGFVITCSAAADVYPKYAEAFEQSVKSFKIF